jgi:hypothetical protein
MTIEALVKAGQPFNIKGEVSDALKATGTIRQKAQIGGVEIQLSDITGFVRLTYPRSSVSNFSAIHGFMKDLYFKDTHAGFYVKRGESVRLAFEHNGEESVMKVTHKK